MPATEQTWYDQKRLHVLFGFSGLALLFATLWMFGADHYREWKGYQRKFRGVEQQLTTWQIQAAKSAEHQALAARLEQQLFEARTEAPDKQAVTEFQQAVLNDLLARGKISQGEYDAEIESLRRWYQGGSEATSDGRFRRFEEDYARLELLAADAAEKRELASSAHAAVEKAQGAVGDLHQQLLALPGNAAEQADELTQQIEGAKRAVKDATKLAERADKDAVGVETQAAKLHDELVAKMSAFVRDAKFREDLLLSERKFKSADVDAAKANLDLAVRDEKPAAERQQLQAVIDELVQSESDGLNALTLKRQAATAHRERLQSILASITQPTVELRTKISDNDKEIQRLTNAFVERRSTFFVPRFPLLGKRWLELPIFDAFNSPLKIDNLWTDGLEIANGSFGKVRRFDRCTTCHRGIAKTAPGTSDKPGFAPQQQIDMTMMSPDSPPAIEDEGNPQVSLADIYGIRLAGEGLIDDFDVTISQVLPDSLAANATAVVDAHGDPVRINGLQAGDVLLAINGDKVVSPGAARQFLTEGVRWGDPVHLTVRRGLPEPFASHPRLDLFVGSLSPHTVERFGCTVCHEGQGSATTFKYASHAPNSIPEEESWMREHGWFHNHHWIFPMYPERLSESTCLKCHHDVAELEASRRFPDPPAPKLVEGWKLIGEYGCYGCHEINGYDGPDHRIGPDLRLEPNYFAAAGAVAADENFSQLPPDVQQWAQTLIQQPFRDDVRHLLREFLMKDADGDSSQLSSYSHKMAVVLQDQETPGTRRKPGPSLRFVASKLGAPFLYDWIREPNNFRPETKMPQFFGLWDHLQGEGRDEAQRLERVEILGMVAYLLDRSQSFEYLQPAEGAQPADAERGKLAFEMRGCIACHQHDDFPHVTSHQGPDLSGLGDKFNATSGAPEAAAWLYSWIKRPTHYHARTKMPDLFLDPIEGKDGKVVDPVADIVEYLLNSKSGWQPAEETQLGMQVNAEDLNRLAAEHLEGAFPVRRAQQYLKNGIPESIAPSLKGAETELVGGADERQKLLYVGRKSITKYGCFGCHDIPGFEDAKPIGAALADWGRKESSKLAFEHILEYLHTGHGHGHGHGQADHGDQADAGHADAGHTDAGHADAGHDAGADSHGSEGDFDEAYYQNQLAMAERSGFLWQKLKEPRSFDFEKVANKKYNDRLRMPLFPLSAPQRESIATFILGLVADPPANEFVYRPEEQGAALVRGRRVLEKYNCAGCHILDVEAWDLEFAEGELGTSPEVKDFPFLATHFTPQQIADSQKTDPLRGVLMARVYGLPAISNDTAEIMIFDEEEDEIDPDEEYDPDTLIYPMELWEPFLLDGQAWEVGARRLNIPASVVKSRWPSWGGDLTKWLLPRVLEEEKKVNPAANGSEAWSWLPPPLMGEGRKVQPDWLYDFLLEPHTIRPAVVLRMPKFNMSPQEATDLVNYFAARDDVTFPFTYDDRMMASHLEGRNAAFSEAHGGKDRLDAAMGIVTSKDYCVQCHFVGDFEPSNNVRALAPDLSEVQFRLQPEYVRDWIANPKTVLPYTAMPVNVQYDADSPTLGGVPQDIYPGTSLDQVDALVDLLINFSEYSRSQLQIKDLVKSTPASEAGKAGSGEENEGGNESGG